MPTELVAAAVLATGYTGPISLEVFNNSLHVPGEKVPWEHARRGMTGLQRLVEAMQTMPAFWEASKTTPLETIIEVIKPLRHGKSKL